MAIEPRQCIQYLDQVIEVSDGAEPVFASPKQGGTDYHAAMAKAGKGHNLGSPHEYQVERLLRAIWVFE